ncbi:MAG: hypothetical protein DWQ44_12535 [Bacteroidetes bacterium]|nr:MAG: hypothetical protein DWQ33_07470 [Bacteroidota bacterium]REK08103.1 MAG: hypothetical protein DWQ39_00680 [Bacteroidota bacterium]REK32308.1 MAG: hypothetical protein DWQ44_12535 [Bacteroidota bacterium]REK49542.1 MAG: hypothetical protein DWQ48_06995 [Bacteroidota bacterium]
MDSQSIPPLLSIAYFPPVSYFSVLCRHESVFIEAKEHFIKQSYRNRTIIYGANGKLSLTIPVHHQQLYRTPIDQVKMLNDGWKKIHWRSIESAYRKAPYFEFYEDRIRNVFWTEEEYLFSYNLILIRTINSILKNNTHINITSKFELSPDFYSDIRNSISPKNKFVAQLEYHQVFSEKFGFIPDLSILDIIFNLGPDAASFLRKS